MSRNRSAFSKALISVGVMVIGLPVAASSRSTKAHRPVPAVTHTIEEYLACGEKRASFKLNNKQTVHVGTFGAIAPQGVILFIDGPEKKYSSSRPLIQNFCHHGFTVFAFNVIGQNTNELSYLKSARVMSQKIRKAYPTQKIVAYGWSKGASVATKLVRENPSRYERLVLESPDLSTSEAFLLANIPRHMTRIFACPADRQVQFKNMRLTKRAYVYVPAHAACGHRLSANAEARDPLVDFIESDFAGVQAQNWYWTRRL